MLLLVLTLVAQTAPWYCGAPVFDTLKPATPVALPAVKRLATPPQPGETRIMWLQNMSVMPPVQYQTNVTCRGIGNHCYVMVEDSAWNAGQMDSADVDRIIERFDHSSPRDSLRGVWDWNTTVLGRPPDAIDNDSLVYLVYQDIGSFHGYTFDGFWQYFDEYYDTTAMRLWGYHSNEVECVYLDCSPNNPAQDYRIAIAAHEFGHMIHWNYDPAESLWVNEGASELAMWLFGSPDDIHGFNSNSDNDLTTFAGEWADYIKTYLWFLYLYEQYGGRVGTDLVHNIIASPAVSIAGINSGFSSTGLPERFEDVFDQWVLANIVNDTTFAGGRYGYFGDVVPPFANAAYYNTYPVDRTGSLQRWAGEYILFQHGRNLELGFDGADARNFRLFVMGKDTLAHAAFIDTVALDSLERGSAIVPGSDTIWQRVYLVPVNHYAAGTAAYAYTASASGIADQPGNSGRGSIASPTMLRAGMLLPVSGRYVLRSPDGRLARRGEDGLSVAGLPAGVYWLSVDGGTRKVIVLP
jgi:hypothetical protein